MGLAPLLYLYLLEKGEDPANLHDLLECLKKLDAEQIIYCLSLKLSKGELPRDILKICWIL